MIIGNHFLSKLVKLVIDHETLVRQGNLLGGMVQYGIFLEQQLFLFIPLVDLFLGRFLQSLTRSIVASLVDLLLQIGHLLIERCRVGRVFNRWSSHCRASSHTSALQFHVRGV